MGPVRVGTRRGAQRLPHREMTFWTCFDRPDLRSATDSPCTEGAERERQDGRTKLRGGIPTIGWRAACWATAAPAFRSYRIGAKPLMTMLPRNWIEQNGFNSRVCIMAVSQGA